MLQCEQIQCQEKHGLIQVENEKLKLDLINTEIKVEKVEGEGEVKNEVEFET